MTIDVAVVGGGPVGCVAALAFAERGRSVAVLEANPRASTRLAGEWLHPRAVTLLERLGVGLPTGYPTGLGFVVFPSDGSREVLLPYEGNQRGASLRHDVLVSVLRRAVVHRSIRFNDDARVTSVTPGRVSCQRRSGAISTLHVGEIVAASGRNGAVHRSLGLNATVTTLSRMAGLVLEDVELPYEGYGHVFLGAPGPILAYRIAKSSVRLCLDVPLAFGNAAKSARLYEHYGPVLPEDLRAAFRTELESGNVEWATNTVRPRRDFGTHGIALVGDAVGQFHPLTAAGLTMGVLDVFSLVEKRHFQEYREERRREGAVPGMLSAALYDVFSGRAPGARDIERAVFAAWRDSAAHRRRTMRLLSGAETGRIPFHHALSRVLGPAVVSVAARAARSGGGEPGRTGQQGLELVAAVRRWLDETPLGPDAGVTALGIPSSPKPDGSSSPSSRGIPLGGPTALAERSTADALSLGVRALLALQDPDGSWEGECIWCPLIAAEYVLAWHLMGQPIPEGRRARLLLHFRKTALPSGLWGLSEVSEPSLFVTTLVYVAARVLGVPASEPMLEPARAFFAAEDVSSIPTWGKLWLSMLSLYEWDGVNPVAPELWEMPVVSPVHPSRYYCHTRLIYVAMSVLYAERFRGPVSAFTHALRAELYPGGYDTADFAAARHRLRAGDLWAKPSVALAGGYRVLGVLERLRSPASRAPLLAKLRRAMKWELAVTSHAAISPVSGLLTMLALFAADPHDTDLRLSIERFECWVWEDDQDGARVAGARTLVWDTSFAVQALVRASSFVDSRGAASAGARSLEAHQVRDTFAGHAENHRSDPCGGYPLSGLWQAWPVSDCTAEAILARLDAASVSPRGGASPAQPSDHDVAIAAAFILRMQGPDGGFGSYEPKRVPFSIEWLNPAEMFGDSMAEAEYVECTASCLAALARVASERPHLLRRAELSGIPLAIERGARAIRRQQLPSGAWDGAWGVRFIYGTWFGIRGLLSSGARPTDDAVRRGCEWLKARQLPDGGWGERLVPHSHDYVAHEEGQVVQTAWALLALTEALDPDFEAIERGARFLARAQLGSGEWPRQEPAGVFFRTAPLDYVLYRSYFPIWALAAYAARREARERLSEPERVLVPATAAGASP